MGSLLRSALNTSERASEPPRERWLEAAVDGLLTVEGERFMLSLPLNIEPNLTAILRPQIINELAELRRVRNRVLKRIDELLRAEWRSGPEARFETRLKEELRRLGDWLAGDLLDAKAADVAAAA